MKEPDPVTTPTLRAGSRRLAVLAAAALAVPVAGCGSSDSSSSAGSADPAKAIPAGAPFYVEATVKPTGKQRTDLEAAGRKILRTNDPAAKLRALIDKAGRKEGKTYAKDIQPWLGSKAAMAITGLSGGAPQFAVVVNSTDDAKARKLIEGDSSFKTKRSFEGTDYRVDPKEGTAGGVVKHYLVMASEPSFKQVAHLLNKGGASMADDKDLQAARDKVGGRPGFMFVDAQRALRAAAGSSNLGSSGLSAVNGLFKRFRAFGVGASADAQAVRLTVASLGPGSGTGAGPGTTLSLDKAPGDAWLAFTQKDIGKTISTTLDSLNDPGSGSAGGSISDAISQFETATGLKVKDDLLSWMGDAQLFVEGDSVPALGGAFVVQSTDPAKTTVAINKIKGLLRRFNQPVGEVPAGTSAGFTLSLGSGKPRLLVGIAGQRFVIAVGRTALTDAISPGATLGQKATFRKSAGLLGTTAKPSFYLDLQTVTRFIGLLAAGDPGFQRAKPYLDAFTAAIGGGTGNGQSEVAVGLK
jgi:Protein of unknown function (DUF3352)